LNIQSRKKALPPSGAREKLILLDLLWLSMVADSPHMCMFSHRVTIGELKKKLSSRWVTVA
jgi:hypothetical protein